MFTLNFLTKVNSVVWLSMIIIVKLLRYVRLILIILEVEVRCM